MSYWWYLILLVLIMGVLSKCSPTIKFYIKFIGFHLSIVAFTAVLPIFALHNPRSSENVCIAQFFMRLLKIEWLFGYDIQVEDRRGILKNLEGPVVMVSNHQTSIDPLVMLKSSPNNTAPIAKKALLYVPIFGAVCWLYGTIFIDRSKGAIETMRNVGIEMKKKKTSIWIFAEGTRHQLDKVMNFKKGAFHLAIQAQVPIIPVVVGNYRNVIDVKNCQFEGGIIRVKPLAPINTDGLKIEDVDELMAKVHKLISDGFDEDYKNHIDLYKNVIPLKEN